MPREPAPGPDQRTGGDPQHADASRVGQPGQGGEVPRLTHGEVLECLGRADGGYTAVCHQPVGGVFCSSAAEPAIDRESPEPLCDSRLGFTDQCRRLIASKSYDAEEMGGRP
jgi:hypothetical protein